MTLAQLVTYHRHSCDLSRRQLAAKLHVEPDYIERMERGEWQPSKHMIWRLADALQTKRNTLLGASDYD